MTSASSADSSISHRRDGLTAARARRLATAQQAAYAARPLPSSTPTGDGNLAGSLIHRPRRLTSAPRRATGTSSTSSATQPRLPRPRPYRLADLRTSPTNPVVQTSLG